MFRNYNYLGGTRWTQQTKLMIFCGIIVLLMVLLIIILAFSLSNEWTFQNLPNCSEVDDDAVKFDCHPERPIQPKKCLDRGCCYVPASDLKVKDSDLMTSSYLGVPSCFFPPDYKGYKVTKNVTRDGSSILAELERVTPSGFEDIEMIAVEVIPIDENRLRIKITDANKRRYVPDVPILNLQTNGEKKNYEVELSEDGRLQVLRRKTNQIMFRTQLSLLIYSDQFHQISIDVPSEFIFGLGEQKESIFKSTHWTRYTLFNQGNIPEPHRNSYGSHPFYLILESSETASGVFLLNTNAMDYILQPKPAVTIRTIGGILDFFVFMGPTPGEVVSQYTTLFGKPNFPPRWSLGFHLSKYGYFTLDKANETLQRNLDAGVPIDAQWLDVDSMEDYLVFTYDTVNFAGLPNFVKALHNDGRHYVTVISPGVSNSERPGRYAAYDAGEKKDLFVKDTEGNYIEGKVWNTNMSVFPDFSNPQTADYWKDRLKEFHSKVHFDGVWLDMNEPMNFLDGSSKGCPDTSFDNPPYLPGRPQPLNTRTLCMSAEHYETEHYNEHNLVAYRESKATHSAMTEITGKRPFIISRASFSGQGVYSGHWSGHITSNWKDMRYSISAMLRFSLYGMAMTGSDICGFRKNATEELCARWYSLGAFYPFTRSHSDNTMEKDPASMGPRVLEAAKKALKKRYFLLPYLYTLFYRNHIAGETVARPLFFEYPEDKETYKIEDEFLWGPALLIMPALYPGIKEINPYFPVGIWYDMDTYLLRKSIGERMKLTIEDTEIKLAIRAGYILPAQVPGKTTKASALKPFHLLVALNSTSEAHGELYWDDGKSLDTIDNEKHNLISFSARKNILDINPLNKGYKTTMNLQLIKVFSLDNEVLNVTINNEDVDKKWMEFKDNVLTLKLPSEKKYSLLDTIQIEWTF